MHINIQDEIMYGPRRSVSATPTGTNWRYVNGLVLIRNIVKHKRTHVAIELAWAIYPTRIIASHLFA